MTAPDRLACEHARLAPEAMDQALGVVCLDCREPIAWCWRYNHLPERTWNRACKNDAHAKMCEQDRDDFCAICSEEILSAAEATEQRDEAVARAEKAEAAATSERAAKRHARDAADRIAGERDRLAEQLLQDAPIAAAARGYVASIHGIDTDWSTTDPLRAQMFRLCREQAKPKVGATPECLCTAPAGWWECPVHGGKR